MKIKLKSLTLVNFKGAKNKTINFTDDTFIYGDNATGKTTLFDAFTWLLFGKDSDNRTDFEVKTLDSDGNTIPKIEHEVTGAIEIDGKPTIFKRTLKEKWVKKRGFEQVHFEGNETTYSVDGVPLNAGQYKAKISEVIDEHLFKLITSPFAFNSLKWQERRDMLLAMAGGIEQDEIIKSMDSSADNKQWLINLLASDKTMDDHKKQIAAQIKKEKEELKMIPTRIDEAERSKPLPPFKSFDSIRKDLMLKTNDLADIEAQMQDKSKAVQVVTDEIAGFKTDLYNLNTQIEGIETEAKAKAKEVTAVDTSGVEGLEAMIQSKTNVKESYQEDIENFDKELLALRDRWAKNNACEFELDESSLNCHVCSKPLDGDNKEETIAIMKENFAVSKKLELDGINSKGAKLKEKKESRENDVKNLQHEIKELKTKLAALSSPSKPTETEDAALTRLILESEAHPKLVADKKITENKIQELEDSMGKPDPTLTDKKTTLSSEIKELNTVLARETSIRRIDVRIGELGGREKELSQSIAGVERSLFILDKYNRASIEALESKIAAKFDLVQFKMFEQQINGGESETCICTVGGVPYSDLNTAMKINAGLDIINTLSQHYEVTAPIFVDGRESVVSLIETNTQIINLIVSEDDKQLRIV